MAASQQLDLKNRRKWPVWMTVQEAAEVLRCHPGTVYEYVKQGILPHIKLGQRVMIDRDGMFFQARQGVKANN